jgi:hypothetical protein
MTHLVAVLAGSGHQQLVGDRGPQRLVQPPVVQAGDRGQERVGHPPAGHRNHSQHLPGMVG